MIDAGPYRGQSLSSVGPFCLTFYNICDILIRYRKGENMDLNVMVAIRDDRTLPTGYHKAVLYAIASRGVSAYPNQSQLMKDAGIGSRNTLVKVIQELEGLGWLTIVKKKHKNNQFKNSRYTVQVPNMTNPCITSDEAIVKSDTVKINKGKVKINILTKNNKSREGWNHSTLSDFILPVSGINNKGRNNE